MLKGELVAEQGNGFRVRHLIDGYSPGLDVGGNRGLAGREQPGALPAALQEQLELPLMPHVVDDDQGGCLLVGQCLAELRRAVADQGKRGRPRGERFIERPQTGEHRGLAGIPSQLDPDDAIGEGVVDLFVVAERLGQGQLAEPASSVNGRRDGQRVLVFVVEQQVTQRGVFLFAPNVGVRNVRDPERCRPGRRRPALEVGDQAVALARIFPVVVLADHPRELLEVGLEAGFLGQHGHDMLAQAAHVFPFPRHPLRMKGFWRQDEKQEPQTILPQDLEDLPLPDSPPCMLSGSNQVAIPSWCKRASSSRARASPSA